MTRILILGGTTEARHLAERLAARPSFEVTVSLAGRTAEIVAHPGPVRIGGFGGVEGLVHYLRAEGIDVLIDATHPYAAIISRNAIEAAARAGVRFLALRRPPWTRRAGDRWTHVANVGEAVTVLGTAPRRVFLALGRQQIAAFVAAPQHFYLIRSIDPVEPPLALPHVMYVEERGPFAETADRTLLEAHRIEAIVCRNSGGEAAYAKIAAARALGVEVLLLDRPELPEAPGVATVEDAVEWLDHAGASAAARGA